MKCLGSGRYTMRTQAPMKTPGRVPTITAQVRGPKHAAFSDVAVNPAGNGHDVEDVVGCRDGGSGVTQYAHLKGKQQEGARDAAHEGEKGHPKCREKRNQWVNVES